MKILLVGNPNAGKSTLFNFLTGAHEKVGNWHGVTVGAAEREIDWRNRKITLVDLPGIYSMDSMSMEEGYTRDYLMSHAESPVVFVSECAGLPRSLPLFFSIVKDGRRAVLVLTKRKIFEREGGKIDPAALEKRLGIPVLLCDNKKKNFAEELFERLNAPKCLCIGREDSLEGIYVPVREGLSRVDRLLCNGFVCIPLFLFLLLFAFFFTFAKYSPGDVMKGGVEWFFCDFLGGFAEKISSPVVRSLIKDGLLESVGGVLSFLPQIALLFFFLTVMDESGFLSRLAMLTDGFFSKLGLNGRAAFSLVMGFGCSAAAILTTRGLDDKNVQRRVILSLPYIPCSAKLPVFLALSASFFSNPFLAVVVLYCLGVLFSLCAAFFLRGETPPFVMEIAPLQIPRPSFVVKSLLFQIKQFIIKVATVVTAFFLLSWFLSSFSFDFRFCGAEKSMLAAVCGWLKFLFAPIGMGDWRIAYAALSGLVAKENVAGALMMFYGGFPYSVESAFAFAVFMLCCSPCVSAITATARELGWKRAILYALFQTVSALLLSYAAYFSLKGGAIYFAVTLVPVIAFFIVRKKKNVPRRVEARLSNPSVSTDAGAENKAKRIKRKQKREKVPRPRRRFAQKFHR